jgi:hypothetical protein
MEENNNERERRLYQIFRLVPNFREVTGNNNGDEEKLGEPDFSQIINDGIFYYKKSVWNTSMGQLIKYETMSHMTPEDFAMANREPSIKEQLDEKCELLKMAREDEDYEYCAELRDDIDELKTKLFEEKKSDSESIKNEISTDDEDDDWNF